jgi:hypothetical protein
MVLAACVLAAKIAGKIPTNIAVKKTIVAGRNIVCGVILDVIFSKMNPETSNPSP